MASWRKGGRSYRLDAPACDSDADVGCPMPKGFPLHGNREQAHHKARGGTPRSSAPASAHKQLGESPDSGETCTR